MKITITKDFNLTENQLKCLDTFKTTRDWREVEREFSHKTISSLFEKNLLSSILGLMHLTEDGELVLKEWKEKNK